MVEAILLAGTFLFIGFVIGIAARTVWMYWAVWNFNRETRHVGERRG